MPRDAQGRHISSITGRIISDIPSSGGGGPSPGCRNGNCGGTCRGGPAPESSTQYNTRPTVNPDSLAKDDTNNYSEVLWETDTTNVYVAVLVRYSAVQKQNGLKVAVYKSDVFRNLDKKKLDLHFYDDKKSPVARFNANKDGVGFALDFIKKGQGDQKKCRHRCR
jgi:hypothetical protein